MMLARLFCTASVILTLGFCGLATGGCSSKPSVRISHAPTYSFMNDPDARAEVELWPAMPGEASSLARADDAEE